jgi:hypothetical protein
MEEDESLLAPSPSASIRAGATPSPKTYQVLRATTALRKPRCTDFGTARRFAFQGQGYFFCNSCNLWDALPADANKKVSMNQTCCKTNHKYFSHPTALCKEDCYIRQKRTVPVVLAPAPSVHACTIVDNILLDYAIESEESNCTRSSDVLGNGCCADEEVEILELPIPLFLGLSPAPTPTILVDLCCFSELWWSKLKGRWDCSRNGIVDSSLRIRRLLETKQD